MNDQDRGMMKWLPYQSLTEQATILARMRYEKNKIPRPHISSDRAKEINEILVSYHGEPLLAKYYEDGYLHRLQGIITRIDALAKFLLFGDKRIEFKNLIDLQRA